MLIISQNILGAPRLTLTNKTMYNQKMEPNENIDIDVGQKNSENHVRFYNVEQVVSKNPLNQKSKMTDLVIKLSGGSIKNPEQANYLLIGFFVFAISISFYLVFGGKEASSGDPIPAPLREQLER